MKNSVKILMKVIYYNIIVLVFLVLSSCGSNNGDIPGDDPTFTGSLQGEYNDEQAGGAKKPGKTYNERLAKQAYEKYCAVCHGTEGKGDGFNSYNLDPRPTDFTNSRYMNSLSHEHIAKAISKGGGEVSKSPLMPAWGNTLSLDDIQRLATYVGSFGTQPLDD